MNLEFVILSEVSKKEKNTKKAGCRRTDAFELWVGEDSLESLGQQGDQTSPS